MKNHGFIRITGAMFTGANRITGAHFTGTISRVQNTSRVQKVKPLCLNECALWNRGSIHSMRTVHTKWLVNGFKGSGVFFCMCLLRPNDVTRKTLENMQVVKGS